MTLVERSRASGLDRTTTVLLLMALGLAFLHHTDHVLRVDHCGWPFRPEVTPFSFSLLAYPTVLFSLLGPRRLLGLRLLLLAVAAGFTLYAHIAIESPATQFAMWAHNHSIDPHAAGLHNLPSIQSSTLGVLAVIIGMALNVVATAATGSMLLRYVRLR